MFFTMNSFKIQNRNSFHIFSVIILVEGEENVNLSSLEGMQSICILFDSIGSAGVHCRQLL